MSPIHSFFFIIILILFVSIPLFSSQRDFFLWATVSELDQTATGPYIPADTSFVFTHKLGAGVVGPVVDLSKLYTLRLSIFNFFVLVIINYTFVRLIFLKSQ